MDVFLINNASEFINIIKESVKYYGADGIWHDPIYTVVGGFTEKTVNNFIENYKKEIDAIIEFASTWDIDPSEWALTDPFDRFKFAAGYIASDIQNELEWEEEQKTA